jgi:hypothetical protein
LQPPVTGTWVALCHIKDTCGMLKITVVEGPHRRSMIVEGQLIPPWADELDSAYHAARTDLGARELVIDLRNLTAISPEGEEIVVQLIRENVKFICGLYLREVLRQLGLKKT